MSPAELVDALVGLGVKLTERTLLNWVNAGVLPEPERSNLGRSRGKIVDYPPDAPFVAYAAWRLKFDGGLKLPDIARIKRDVDEWWAAKAEEAPIPRSVMYTPDHFAWVVMYRIATFNVPVNVPVIIQNYDQPGMTLFYPRSAAIEGHEHVVAGILPSKGLEAKLIELIKANRMRTTLFPYD